MTKTPKIGLVLPGQLTKVGWLPPGSIELDEMGKCLQVLRTAEQVSPWAQPKPPPPAPQAPAADDNDLQMFLNL
jgi:hypothetical protein